jgi:hypothetical protein
MLLPFLQSPPTLFRIMIWAFSRKYFSGPAGVAACVLFLLGWALGKESMSRLEWWKAYWQAISATLVGLSLEVLLLQFLLELQRKSLMNELREGRELAAYDALKRVIPRLKAWLPHDCIPETAHVTQLEWARSRVAKVREVSEALALDIDDPHNRQLLDTLTEQADEFCDSIDKLVHSIRMVAPRERRETNLSNLWLVANSFIASAEPVQDELDKRRSAILTKRRRLNGNVLRIVD